MEMLILGGVSACDPYWSVVVTASLPRPLPPACIQSALDTIVPGNHSIEFGPSRGAPKGARGTTFWVGSGNRYAVLSQYEFKDSTAELGASVSRFQVRFKQDEVDTIGLRLGTTLVRVRNACGGTGMAGSASYKIEGNRLRPW